MSDTRKHEQAGQEIKATSPHSGDIGLEQPVHLFDKPLATAYSEKRIVIPENANAPELDHDDLTYDQMVLEELKNLEREEARIAELRKADPEKKTETAVNSNPFGRFVRTKFGKVVIGGTVLLAGTGITVGAVQAAQSGNDGQVPDEGTVGGSEVVTGGTTEIEQIAEKVTQRPELGSPEYDALFEELEIPYIEGQPAVEVIQKALEVSIAYQKLGYTDGPMTFDEQTQYAIENNITERQATLESIRDNLDLGYFDRGALPALLGPDYQDTPFGQEAAQRFVDVKNSTMPIFLSGVYGNNFSVTITEPNILYETATEIAAKPVAYNALGSAENPNSTVGDLYLTVITDEDGSRRWIRTGFSADAPGL